MQVQIKNLTIDFSTTEAEFSGGSYLTIPSNLMEEFMEDCSGCQYGEDEFAQAQEDKEENGEWQELYTSNTDLQIIFMAWALEQDNNISFEYEGDSLFWLYHDYYHAINDVTGIEIYVNGQLEAERHYQAIGMLKERGELGCVDIELFINIQKEFGERGKWDRNFNEDDFNLEKALELAEIEPETFISCTMCGCEDEPTQLEEDLFKCEECDHEGEEYEFKYQEHLVL
jgi:hypothetical protein